MGYDIPADHHRSLSRHDPLLGDREKEHTLLLAERLERLCGCIHGANVAAGWWSDLETGESILATRNRGELMMLVVSELAEAYEGLVSSAADDHLPQYPMFHVELADTAIRLFDLIGADAFTTPSFISAQGRINKRAMFGSGSIPTSLLQIICDVVRAMEHHRKGRTEEYVSGLIEALHGVFALAQIARVDLFPIIDAKLDYNARRADHKVESRRAEGGKAY